jgi:hypothetical protein
MSIDALLHEIERQANIRNAEVAFSLFADLLHVLRGKYHLAQPPLTSFSGHPLLAHFALCERAARAWGQIMLEEAFDPSSSAKLPIVLAHLPMLHALAHGTSEGNFDTWIRLLDHHQQGRYSPQALSRLLMLLVPGTSLDISPYRFHQNFPEIVTAQAISAIAGMTCATKESDRSRNAAIDFLCSNVPQVADYSRVGIGGCFQDAWMRCSYAEHSAKHRAKRFLNEISAKIVSRDTTPTINRHRTGNKPVMVVPLDSFDSRHAMFRCYGSAISECRTYFQTIAIAERSTLDEKATAIFDHCHYIDEECLTSEGIISLPAVMELIKSYSPAVVLYPSIGMSLYTILLSNYRLAPLQVMSYGHPATSASPHIDVGITEKQWIGNPSLYTEKIIGLPTGTFQFTLPDGCEPPNPATSEVNQSTIRIAIPSVCQKWSKDFLESLASIEKQSEKPIEFHFFSGVHNIYYPAAANAVRRVLPMATIHPFMPYNRYLETLQSCSIHAGTFPFGGTNSLVDSLTCGIPIVCIMGQEAQGRVDADFALRAGLPSWLVAEDKTGFVDAAVRLINEPGLLTQLREDLTTRRSRIAQQLTSEGRPSVFAQTLNQLVLGTQPAI